MQVEGNLTGGGSGGSGRGDDAAAENAQAWTRVKRRLRAELGEDIFASWFARLELEEVNAGTARLSVPTRFLKSWIESHYLDRVLNTFRSELEQVARIEVGVRGTGAPARPAAPKPLSAATAAVRAPAAPAPLTAPASPSATETDAPRGPSGSPATTARRPSTTRSTSMPASASARRICSTPSATPPARRGAG